MSYVGRALDYLTAALFTKLNDTSAPNSNVPDSRVVSRQGHEIVRAANAEGALTSRQVNHKLPPAATQIASNNATPGITENELLRLTEIALQATTCDEFAALAVQLMGLNFGHIKYILTVEAEDTSTPMHRAAEDADNLQALAPLLDKLKPAEVYELLMVQEDNGTTPMHYAAKVPARLQALEPLLNKLAQELTSAEARDLLMALQEWSGRMPMRYAARNSESLQVFEPLLNKLTAAHIRELLTVGDVNEITLMHSALGDGIEQQVLAPLLSKLAQKLTSRDIYYLLTVQDKDGDTPMRLALRNPASLPALAPLLDKLKPAEIDKLLKGKDEAGDTILHEAAWAGAASLRALKPLLDKLKPEEIKRMLATKDKMGLTLLHRSAQAGKEGSTHVFLEWAKDAYAQVA